MQEKTLLLTLQQVHNRTRGITSDSFVYDINSDKKIRNLL
jgi:hypothetical protein